MVDDRPDFAQRASTDIIGKMSEITFNRTVLMSQPQTLYLPESL
ncbi:hypothetical protein QT998_22230 [Microcoleus sp. S1D4]